MNFRLFAIALIVFIATCAHAGSTSCATATSLVPDGRLLDFDNVPPSPNPSTPTSNWYQFTAIAGRSYSIEVRDDLDSNNSDLQVTYFGPNGFCPSPPAITSASAAVTDTHAAEPVLPASASRSSIVTCAANFPVPCTSSGAGTYWIKVQNTSTTLSHYVTVSANETTIYSTVWSTNSGVGTQYIFQNTTSQTISYTFTLTAYSPGTQTVTSSGNIGAISASSPVLNTGTAALGVSAGQTGYAIFTHNAPPGAVQAFAVWQNYSTTPITAIPLPIGPMRGK